MSPPISSWKKLIVSGSDAEFTRVFSTSITGSFSGDGTQITNINSASYALTASYALISAAGGGSALSSSVVVESYTFVGNNVTTNYQISKSYSDSSVTITVGGLTYINPDDYSISGSTIVFVEPPLSSSNISVKALMNVAQNATGSFSGSFLGIVSNATSASYALTASYASQFTVDGVTTTAGISSSNHITPSVDNTYNLGAPNKRWANIYTGDLVLSNEGSSGNIVDGTTGNWTVQEGQEYLYIINNTSGKKYRFMLEEIK